MTDQTNTYALVADIGGTNTRVALADGFSILEGSIQRYANSAYAGLEQVLQHYLKEADHVKPLAACVAVAGPVQDGKATMTNLDWTMDETTLAAATNASTVAILNDLQAQGHAVGHIADDKLIHVLTGKPAQTTAAKLVVGVGTGFNTAPVIEAVGGRVVPPSESGHATLPTRTVQDAELSAYISNITGFSAIEDALSGRGIENIYGFVTKQNGSETRLLANEIMTACDAGDADAIAAVQICVRLLGSVCGNLALTLLPFGGIYLVGGVSRALAPHLATAGFADSFYDKGRFGSFLQSFPVSVVTDDYAALTGCAAYLEQNKST